VLHNSIVIKPVPNRSTRYHIRQWQGWMLHGGSGGICALNRDWCIASIAYLQRQNSGSELTNLHRLTRRRRPATINHSRKHDYSDGDSRGRVTQLSTYEDLQRATNRLPGRDRSSSLAAFGLKTTTNRLPGCVVLCYLLNFIIWVVLIELYFEYSCRSCWHVICSIGGKQCRRIVGSGWPS